MTRKRTGVALLVTASAVLLIVWIGSHTYWEDVRVPMPPKGEALIDPFYAARRFAETLGARTSWDRLLVAPPAGAVVVLSGWHWSLGRTRRATLEHWVESGGRLVVDRLLLDPADEFERWSGISRRYPENSAQQLSRATTPDSCREVREELLQRPSGSTGRGTLMVCGLGLSWLETPRSPTWVLRDARGIQAIRVAVGRGSVTVVNAELFRWRELFDGDDDRVFVDATQLHRGDEVHFLTEDEYPSLLALTWHYAAPAVIAAAALIAALLWRAAIRFGPTTPPPHAARRSLAEQIRGSGRFALRYGGGRELHAACVRALDEAARRRIGQYKGLPTEERVAAVARVTGFDQASLSDALHLPRRSTATHLDRSFALLEAARRALLTRTTLDHGTR